LTRSWEKIFRLKTRPTLLAAVIALLLLPSFSRAQNTTTQTLEATIVPLGGLFTFISPLTLARTGGSFNGFSGSMILSYRARTSRGSGEGTITVKATVDFTPAGGPSIASPLTSGDALSYTSTVASPGTAASAQTVAALATSYPVATFGAGASSAIAGNTANSVAWSLTNDPTYAQGSYSVTVTFTISAT
jgi:hypothetical protein